METPGICPYLKSKGHGETCALFDKNMTDFDYGRWIVSQDPERCDNDYESAYETCPLYVYFEYLSKFIDPYTGEVVR